MHNRIIIITLALLMGQNVLLAEMRTWSDKKGNTIEAEFVNIVGGKVALKTAKGKLLKVPVSGLSAADQKFLENAIPPRFGITVNVDVDSKKVETYSHSRINETVQGTVTIEKKNREPCAKQFKATLYTLAQELDSNEYQLIDSSEHSFSFKTQKKVVFTGKKGKTSHSKWLSYSSKGEIGQEYKGYLVVIRDDKGMILCSKGSRKLFEDRASQFKGKKKGSTLSFLSRN